MKTVSSTNGAIISRALMMGMTVTVREKRYKLIAGTLHSKNEEDNWVALDKGEYARTIKKLFPLIRLDELEQLVIDVQREEQKRKRKEK